MISIKKFSSNYFALALVVIVANIIGACTTLPSSGPHTSEIKNTQQNTPVIKVVEVNDAITRKLIADKKQNLFSETFKAPAQSAYAIGLGDVLEISIWEAPPATLFGNGVLDTRTGLAGTRVTTLPEQMVNAEGMINIPFAGSITVNGLTPNQIEQEIVRRLKGKANQPQVLVRMTHNNSANVTVVGEVVTNTRMPLTARGERLLDALASAGGVRQSINKMTLQLTRGNQTQALALETIIRDPRQNITLQPGDVITSLFQPLSFSVLGATGKNEEINFETQGISLAQALARAGGLQDARADARGVFIFRFENEEKTPVIYRINFKEPSAFFVAQNFPIQNKDILYVSNAPAAELQKFLNLIVSTIYPVSSVINMSK